MEAYEAIRTLTEALKRVQESLDIKGCVTPETRDTVDLAVKMGELYQADLEKKPDEEKTR